MDSTILLGYLGHSSIYPEFDDFMLQNGIKKRPKKNESSEAITDSATGIVLRFQSSVVFDEESLISKKSDGKFILTEVSFPRGCSASPPYGISLAMPKSEVDKILGTPKDETIKIPLAIYVYKGFVITINWNKASPSDAFIRFALPNKYD